MMEFSTPFNMDRYRGPSQKTRFSIMQMTRDSVAAIPMNTKMGVASWIDSGSATRTFLGQSGFLADQNFSCRLRMPTSYILVKLQYGM